MTTKHEFEQAYAQRSGVTVEWLHEHSRVAVSCDCGHDECGGWAMAHTEPTDKVLPVDWADRTSSA